MSMELRYNLTALLSIWYKTITDTKQLKNLVVKVEFEATTLGLLVGCSNQLHKSLLRLVE